MDLWVNVIMPIFLHRYFCNKQHFVTGAVLMIRDYKVWTHWFNIYLSSIRSGWMKLLDTLNDVLLSGLSASCASVSFAGGLSGASTSVLLARGWLSGASTSVLLATGWLSGAATFGIEQIFADKHIKHGK